MKFKRYGIYYTPPAGPFAESGAKWLGWDPATGDFTEPVAHSGLPFPWDEITATPRKYGFHATIKPPFRLAADHSFEALELALAAHCATQAPVVLDSLSLAPLGRFLALIPEGDTTDLVALAAATVRDLDAFRAPATDDELARRRATDLTPIQEALLQRWGYPYVMEAFRFHMTLTGKLPKSALSEVAAALESHILPHVPRPLLIDALSLMGEDDAGRFHLIHRKALSG